MPAPPKGGAKAPDPNPSRSDTIIAHCTLQNCFLQTPNSHEAFWAP